MSTTRQGGQSRKPYDDGSGSGEGGFNLGLHCGDYSKHVSENRAQLDARLPSSPMWLQQVHGANVVEATHALTGEVIQADASFTTKPGIVCAVMTADCLPVLFWDAAGRVVAAAHAGWRGLAAGILQNTVQAMRAAGATSLHAWLGPAIGPTYFEVGAEVYRAFVDQAPGLQAAFTKVPTRADYYFADLQHIARQVLAGVNVMNVTSAAFCTASMPSHFYSYRRDHHTGRMASLIWIK